MISYHLAHSDASKPWLYARGFKTADTNDPHRIAKGVNKYVWSPCIFKDGQRAARNFVCADWLALDFDSPEMTLNEACKLFCDSVHIIGTTKSHRIEKHGVVCDRFRVILKLSARVKDLKTYELTAKKLVARYPADPAPKDGGRFFFPCTSTVQVVRDGFTEDPVTPPSATPEELRLQAYAHFDEIQYRRFGTLPGWVSAFLERGRLCRNCGRNQTIYAVARELAKFGIPERDCLARVLAAPIAREKLSDPEIARTVSSGYCCRKD